MAATISYRGFIPLPEIQLKVIDPSGTESLVQPAALTDASGRPMWRASFTPNAPGDWRLTIVDPRDNAPPVPETIFTVPHPPQENDDLSADPEFLANIAAASSGESLSPAAAKAYFAKNLVAEAPATRESGAVWQPVWNRPLIAIVIAALLSAEWFFRRRQGLA